MKIMSSVSVTALEKVVADAATTLKGTFIIETTGLVNINTDQSNVTVPYGSSVTITCHPPEPLGIGSWTFQQNWNTAVITNGTEATIIQGYVHSMVSISKVSEVWKGTFTCRYKSKNSTFITHTANIFLDVALLPQITITSWPPCPSCRGGVSPVSVLVKCIIFNQTEEYTVHWTSATPDTPNGTPIPNGQISYQATAQIFCDQKSQTIDVECNFLNRLNQTQNNSITIPIIYDDSLICKGENSWPDVKASYTVTQLCEGARVGVETRACSAQGSWYPEISQCVNTDLHDLLNDAKNLQRGQGIVESNADLIFSRLRQSTENSIFNTHANINASVEVMGTMTNASTSQNSTWSTTVFPDVVKSSSNLLNDSLLQYWKYNQSDYSLAVNFLSSFEGVIKRSKMNSSAIVNVQQENVQIVICNQTYSNKPCNTEFNASITEASNTVIQTGFKNLNYSLPFAFNNVNVNTNNIILSVISLNNETTQVTMSFAVQRLPNYKMYCVYLNESTSQWSDDGCRWGGADFPNVCHCIHNSAFTILMSKAPIHLLYEDELTNAGLGFSISSLALCLVIECVVWNTVVKSSISHFRHTVLVNIMFSLLIANCCFLTASSKFQSRENWCLVLTVIQHFCLLAMFFWTLCLSMGLLHQLIFVFVNLRKKVYLGLSFSLGYVCPLIIVTITIISHNNGAPGLYYDTQTCWLIHKNILQGSIYSFIIPVGIIVIVNMFTMVVVISRILKPTVSEGKTHDEKEVARSIVKTVVFLTPTLGITWVLGLFVIIVDLTTSPLAQIVNYSFIIFNSFQGFFILLSGCLGEKRVRDALLNHFKQQQSAHYKSETSSKRSAIKNK
ncbi:adhesion G protein-coupled receptor F5 isoform X2 [Brachyhypopomus gauderio]